MQINTLYKLRNRYQYVLGDFTRATFYGNLQKKISESRPAGRACAVACIGRFRKSPFTQKFQVKGRRRRASKSYAANFVRVCVIKIHLEISQEPLNAEI